MLLAITNTSPPAADLGYLLHKHPARVQSFEQSFGRVHVFYPEASDERCTAALLLDVDPVGLVRGRRGPSGERGTLDQYVNDRPYVASSFMSVAIAQVYGSALGGRCPERPDLVDRRLSLEARIAVLPCRGGEAFLRRLFEPLGYEVTTQGHGLDQEFPDWGESSYFTVTLRAEKRLADLLAHLYVLIPVLDNDKHYWVGQDELEKLLRRGEGWLADHPERHAITTRYLKHQRRLAREALARLAEEDHPDPDAEQASAAREEAALEAAVLGIEKTIGASDETTEPRSDKRREPGRPRPRSGEGPEGSRDQGIEGPREQEFQGSGNRWIGARDDEEDEPPRPVYTVSDAADRASIVADEYTAAPIDDEAPERGPSLNAMRLATVLAALRASGARSVVDLGCGEGRLLRLLLDDRGGQSSALSTQREDPSETASNPGGRSSASPVSVSGPRFERIVGMDVSLRSLRIAAERLRLERMPPMKRRRIDLIHGSLMYRDARLEGFDAATCVEVVEHLDPPRLAAFERAVFEFARPRTVVVTTPNREYNVLFESLPAGRFRHRDHRFEWTRAEFQAWARGVAERFGYAVRFLPVGPEDAAVGPPTQMGVFTLWHNRRNPPMHAAELSFRKKPNGRPSPNVVHSIYGLIHALERSGQVIPFSARPIVCVRGGYRVFASIPEPTSLRTSLYTKSVQAALTQIKESGLSGPVPRIIGPEAESDPVCRCRRPERLFLYTHHLSTEPPLSCGECAGVVPFYRVPGLAGSKTCDAVLYWACLYRHIDAVWTASGAGERAAYRELSRYDGGLSKLGRGVCRDLEQLARRRAYYYLYRYYGRGTASERRRRCPGCRGTWLLKQLWHGRFDFRCDRCRLVSEFACDA